MVENADKQYFVYLFDLSYLPTFLRYQDCGIITGLTLIGGNTASCNDIYDYSLLIDNILINRINTCWGLDNLDKKMNLNINALFGADQILFKNAPNYRIEVRCWQPISGLALQVQMVTKNELQDMLLERKDLLENEDKIVSNEVFI